MLHIKDIEAFARINEALNEEPGAERAERPDQDGAAEEAAGRDAAGPAHPALVMALLATGRLPFSALPKSSIPPKPDAPVLWGGLRRRS
ncbi:hypothetical protein [Azospirillum endophyticum]